MVNKTEKRNDVFGILTPVVDGRRMFMNVQARQLFDMEAEAGEREVLSVGKFVFSKKKFDKAIQIIRDAIHREGWLVIDEIGPMELRGEGFCGVLKEVLASGNEKQKILLVIREGLVDKTKEFFQIKDAVIINTISILR
ncbi:MAG: nucleoside-triphosphatase [Bacteroidota bacterium]